MDPDRQRDAGEGKRAGELLERVQQLAPLLSEQAPEAERLRRPTDASIAALVETGVFRLMVPRCYGGLELDLDAFVDVGLALGRVDASIAWVTTFYVEHNWMLCQFPEPFQRALFADRSHVLAPAAIAPSGRARREGEGFRVRGRWQWGTGVMHAEWVIVGADTAPEGSRPELRFFAFPAADVKVEDTWYVDGMIGTGSNDMVVEDVWVPEERSVPIPDMAEGRAPGSRLHEGPLYRTPMIPILMLAASLPIVGLARAVAEGFRERLGEHVRLFSKRVRGAKPAAQIRLARAAIEARQSESLLREVAGEVCALRAEASPEDRTRWAASLTHAVHQSRRVIAEVAEASGASAHFQANPLQRALRDANVATCHVAFDRDAQLELYGRLLLGFEPNSTLF